MLLRNWSFFLFHNQCSQVQETNSSRSTSPRSSTPPKSSKKRAAPLPPAGLGGSVSNSPRSSESPDRISLADPPNQSRPDLNRQRSTSSGELCFKNFISIWETNREKFKDDQDGLQDSTKRFHFFRSSTVYQWSFVWSAAPFCSWTCRTSQRSHRTQSHHLAVNRQLGPQLFDRKFPG